MGRLRHFGLVLALVATGAWAQGSAQDELEKQLREMVGNPPTKILINFTGLDEPQFKVVDASFALDGTSLPGVLPDKLNGEGVHLIWHGDVKPGSHKVEAKVTITDVSGALFSYEAGYKWNPTLSVGFKSDPGIEVQINVTPKVNRDEKDIKKRISLSGPAALKMLARLEDGELPPPPKPNLPVKEVPDAGQPPLTPAEKAKLAAEEKKRLKEEAAAAAAAKVAEKKAAALAAAEEKKRQRDEALAAAAEKKSAAAAAAAEKKAAALAEAEERKRIAAGGAPRVVEPVAAEVPDAGATPVVAEAPVDAGAPVVAVVEPPRPQVTPAEPPKPASDEGGPPLPLLIGGGIAVLGLIIFLIARRKSNQPPY